MNKDYMFTSESVTEGHPDKLCDQISDAIVDHFLMQDPCARLRIESAVSSAIVFIAGHFATKGKVDLTHVARKVIKRIGYDQPDFNAKTCSILTAPTGLPPDKYFLFDEYRLSDGEIEKIAVKAQATVFDFRLAAILRDLRLRHLPAEHPEGFYAKLAAYGHFGRMDMDLPWEQTDKAELLKSL